MYTQSNQSNNLLLATDYASLCLTRYNMLTKCHAIELILHPSSKNSKKFLFEVVERESFSFFSFFFFFFFFFLEVHFQVCNDEQVTKRKKKKKVGPYCADRVPKSWLCWGFWAEPAAIRLECFLLFFFFLSFFLSSPSFLPCILTVFSSSSSFHHRLTS